MMLLVNELLIVPALARRELFLGCNFHVSSKTQRLTSSSLHCPITSSVPVCIDSSINIRADEFEFELAYMGD